MAYYINTKSMPSSPRSKSPPKKVFPYTPNSPKHRKSELSVYPTTDFDLNPIFSLEKGGKAVANSLYNFSVGIETRLPIVLQQILDFRDCVPLENHVFDKFVNLIDSGAACPSDCQYILLTIPVQMILYKNLIPSKHVLTQFIERAERLLSPDNFFVTYKSHQILPRYHIQEMIRLFKLLLGEETPDLEEFINNKNASGTKFIEMFAKSGSIDEQILEEEEKILRSKLPIILQFELEQMRAKKEKEERENEEKQRAALEKIQQEERERQREILEREEKERLRRLQEEREKELEDIQKATRLRIAKQNAAKRKAAKEKAEKEKAEKERLENERIEREKLEKEEKEKREREARMMAIRKMAARKKAQLERAEREKEVRLRLEKEARERKELFEREERERKNLNRETALRTSRDRIQIEKEKKEKAQRERERLIQIAKEKEAKEREELHLDKANELKRANSLQVKDIKRLLNPEEFEDEDQKLTPKLKGKSEGRFNLNEAERKRSKSLKTPIKSDNFDDENNEDKERHGKRNLELSPVDEKESSYNNYYNSGINLSLSPTQDNETTRDYQSKSIQKFLSEELSLKERINIGNEMSLNLDPEEREKLMKYAQLFVSWETAYHAVKEVWMVMKKDDKFDVNVLLSMMPVTFADYTVTGLKTFANDEGISIADIENMYDRML